MKILVVSPTFSSGGGADKFAAQEVELLRSHGHTVSRLGFGGVDSEGYYAVPENVVSQKGDISFHRLAELGRAAFFNRDAANVFRLAIETESPEIIHFHRVKPFSISLLTQLDGRERRPAIMTIHDHYVTCPTSTRLHGDLSPCHLEQCRASRCLVERCAGGSLTRSAASLLEYRLRNNHVGATKHISAFISPSRYMQERLMLGGIAEDRISYIPNFVEWRSEGDIRDVGSHIAYVGRLSSEKGIMTLLLAASQTPLIPYVLVGEGPLRPMVEAFISTNRLGNVKLAGFLSGEDLRVVIRQARATVLPSECFENAPLAVLESLAEGRPVIGSKRGGIPELVDDGVTGRLFEPGNAASLANVVSEVWTRAEHSLHMGEAGRRVVRERFSEEAHYSELMKLYERVVSMR